MQKNVIRIFLLAAICCALSGCGTKGPLYIPEQRYPQNAEKAHAPQNQVEKEAVNPAKLSTPV